MKLQIYYDPYLNKEAQVVQKIIQKVFGFKTSLHKKQRDDLLSFDEDLGIYEAHFPKNVLNTVYITGNQIAANSADSAYEFAFGKAYSKRRNLIISLARLRSKNMRHTLDFEDSSDEVTPSVLKKRLELVSVHEIGHWAIANQDHFDELDHQPYSGTHCKDKHCVMYPGLLNKSSIYKDYFCPLCKKAGFINN